MGNRFTVHEESSTYGKLTFTTFFRIVDTETGLYVIGYDPQAFDYGEEGAREQAEDNCENLNSWWEKAKKLAQ